jgi:hypothetical protein
MIDKKVDIQVSGLREIESDYSEAVIAWRTFKEFQNVEMYLSFPDWNNFKFRGIRIFGVDVNQAGRQQIVAVYP